MAAKDMTEMKKIVLKQGYGCAYIPHDWRIINEEEAGSSKYAYAFESGSTVYVFFSEINYFDIPARDSEIERARQIEPILPEMVYALSVRGAEIPHVICGIYPYGAYIERPDGYNFDEDNMNGRVL